MLIVLLIILILFFLIILLIFSRSRVYISLDWHWDENDKYMQYKISILHITFYQKTIDFDQLAISFLEPSKNGKKKEMYSLVKTVLKKSNMEKIQADTIVATYDPAITAYLYVSISSLAEWIKAQYSHHLVQLNVSADFEQETFQSAGECMISIKLSKTIKELKKMNKLRKEY